jgi:hypothetical protein
MGLFSRIIALFRRRPEEIQSVDYTVKHCVICGKSFRPRDMRQITCASRPCRSRRHSITKHDLRHRKVHEQIVELYANER